MKVHTTLALGFCLSRRNIIHVALLEQAIKPIYFFFLPTDSYLIIIRLQQIKISKSTIPILIK